MIAREHALITYSINGDIRMDSQQLLTPREVSELLGVSEQTLAIWRSNRRYSLKYVKVGRYVRYRYADIVDFIHERTVSTKEARS